MTLQSCHVCVLQLPLTPRTNTQTSTHTQTRTHACSIRKQKILQSIVEILKGVLFALDQESDLVLESLFLLLSHVIVLGLVPLQNISSHLSSPQRKRGCILNTTRTQQRLHLAQNKHDARMHSHALAWSLMPSKMPKARRDT